MDVVNVTIIIPIHNSERYLEDCINSALSQDFKQLEILCIDGGSLDKSEAIVKHLQEKDHRIIYIHDSNTSYGHKINVGIDKARGRYISILESDDKMEPNMIIKLYHAVEKYNADVVDADYYELLDDKSRELRSAVQKYSDPKLYNRIIDYREKIERDIVSNGIWTALYKKSFLIEEKIRLNESPGASYQDLSFLFLTSLLAKRVYHINIPLYQYRVNNAGSSVKDDKKIFEIMNECQFLKEDLQRRGIRYKVYWDLYYIRKYNAFYWNFCRLSSKTRNAFLEKYIQEIEYDIKNKAIESKVFSTLLYDQTFLLLDDLKEFVKKAEQNSTVPCLLRIYRCLERLEGREVVIVGCGILGTRVIDVLLQNHNQIRGICDNSESKQGTFIQEFKVFPVSQMVIEFPKAMFFIASSKHGEEITEQLKVEGIKKDNIVVLE